MMLKELILGILFPPRCILCRAILSAPETDLCHGCRTDQPVYASKDKKIRFVKEFTALWYYEGNVRKSLIRYKFSNARHYGPVYGRLLGMRLLREELADVDLVTWVPIGPRRLRKRGYDQVEILARAVARELELPGEKTLVKPKDNPPQSGIRSIEARKANVLGMYRIANADAVKDKRVLLLDDIVTTGATVSECARVLLSAGAKEVICAAVAAGRNQKQ